MKTPIILLNIITIILISSCSNTPFSQKKPINTTNDKDTSIINPVSDNKNEKINIDILNNKNNELESIFYKDISLYQEEITKWLNEFINNISIINYEVFNIKNWYTKKIISIEWDRVNLVYSFFIKQNQLYGVRKSKYNYNLPKWEKNSNIESEEHIDCNKSLNNCSKDILFLYDFIQKTFTS